MNPFKSKQPPKPNGETKKKAADQEDRLRELQRQARALGVELDVLRKDSP